MLRKATLTLAATAVAALGSAGVASAAVDFDPATGSGFVGKGDVQLALSLNNVQLQQQARTIEGEFTYVAERVVVTEVEWVCTNNRDATKTQERERTTTTTSSITGVVAATARDGKKQITGFNLNRYSGDPVVSQNSTHDGPQVNSCPASSTLTTPAGNPVVLSDETTGGLFVRGVALS